MLGENDGASDGIADGSIVGMAEGWPVGMADGWPVGMADGRNVMVGCTVGSNVGTPHVGEGDGMWVGAKVGVLLGKADGGTVGVVLGTRDGSTVGLLPKTNPRIPSFFWLDDG